MNIGNITSNGMNLDINGTQMKCEIYEKEIERLNNIIDELEKYVNSKIIYLKDSNELDEDTILYCLHKRDVYKEILDKLKELKENKK